MDKFWAGKVIRPDESEVPSKDGVPEDKKIVCFYFSAHWCPPCRQFTPMLKEFHDKTKDQGVVVVFVSSDKTEKDMNEYFNESHGDWLRVPHKSTLAKELKGHFHINGIPTLVVCKRDGKVITTDGVEQVAENGALIVDKWVNGFDWQKAEENLALIQDAEFVRSDNVKVSGKTALKSKKLVCFYFSAHWCPPCRHFTPVLREFYSEVQDDLEVVFVSADNTEEEMNSNYEDSHGDWLRAEHESDISNTLMKHFDCQYFPFMVVVKAGTGAFVTKEGAGIIRKDYKATKGREIVSKWMA